LLNEYAFVCLGANLNLFSINVIKEMREDALRQTWIDYRSYIGEHREAAPENIHAWIECDTLLKRFEAPVGVKHWEGPPGRR
jgi:hypothetical protein